MGACSNDLSHMIKGCLHVSQNSTKEFKIKNLIHGAELLAIVESLLDLLEESMTLGSKEQVLDCMYIDGFVECCHNRSSHLFENNWMKLLL